MRNSRTPHNDDWPDYEFSNSIESSKDRRLIRRVALLICFAIAILLLWSTQATVEEISKSKGQIIPLGHKQVIQSQSGGTIASVDVEEGQMVKKGQHLVHFVSEKNLSTKDELEVKRANFEMRIKRYDAYINKQALDLTEYATKYPKLTANHIEAFDKMKEKREASEKVIESEIQKTNAELSGVLEELPSLRNQLKASHRMYLLMKEAGQNQSISEVKFLETKQKYDSYQQQVNSLNSRSKVLKRSLDNLNKQLIQKDIDLVSEVSEKRTEAQTDLIATNARLRSSAADVKDDVVKAPVEGVIQSIPTTSAGSVVKPGGMVAVIVPVTKQGLMETKLSPRDIGFVQVGDLARIKIDAFDYSRYGSLTGVVKSISPTTDQDERGGVYYKVKIAIAKPYFEKDPEYLKTIPGMTGEADIITGKKTVFEYLWKPVFTNMASAFGER
ncbi:HlyD family type I secretion periplasmic adaptor subunit [Vibrio sp. B1Z05]|uniref:HlyD family type I secretion periplasmic adaptor subunit n=1 Tax=Vibrio sp. B1Z05 TaxID=2654980 RepID=UPI00128D47C2|nr:HlyD family type I secretion periplasmic adaptor subunit [Vibrio sp. B1Z05]MPW35949.1 HlyD family type I secretion periplasmic adaptor subunit [Vibrio sp. B1Z05]